MAKTHDRSIETGATRKAGTWRRPVLVVAALLAAGSPEISRADPSGTAVQERGEILVVAADRSFVPYAEKIGFAPVDGERLDALGLAAFRLRTPAALSTVRALAAFRRYFPELTADLNAVIRPAAGRHDADATGTRRAAVSPGACGAGIRIGMIDTPVDTDHRAFRGRHVVYRSFLAGDARPAAADHGTAIAAMLVGDPESEEFGGLLPQATLLAANIFVRRWPGPPRGDLFAMLKALDWLAGARAQVINLSLETGPNRVLSAALDKAARHGIVLTAAAGHRGVATGPAFPAAHEQVIAVTAVDARMKPYRHARRGDYIDFAAPGVGLWTAAPAGGAYNSGTSFAVPFLTAAAALRLAAGLRPDAGQLRAALARGARDLGPPGRDDVFGWGLVEFPKFCA